VFIVTGVTGTPLVNRSSVERFRVEGFLLFKGAFDPGPLADEIELRCATACVLTPP
jgi:hypothetical protein